MGFYTWYTNGNKNKINAQRNRHKINNFPLSTSSIAAMLSAVRDEFFFWKKNDLNKLRFPPVNS